MKMQRERPLILVAERDPFMQASLRRILEPHFDLMFVEDGAAVVEAVRENRPALVILEALLPTVDGFQACYHLKSHPETRDIPVLFFTLLLAKERAAQVGADRFLLKPLQREVLLDHIWNLVGGSPTAGNGDERSDEC